MTRALSTLASLRASLPDPSAPELIALGGTLGGFVGGVYGLLVGPRSRDDIYWRAFIGGILGTAVTLAIYLFGFVTDIY